MDITILTIISSIAIIITVLSYILPNDIESVYHGIRFQKIWLCIFSAMFWFVISISMGNVDYRLSGSMGIETVTVDASVIIWLFAGLGVMQILYAIMLLLEHINEEASDVQSVIDENIQTPIEEAEYK